MLFDKNKDRNNRTTEQKQGGGGEG